MLVSCSDFNINYLSVFEVKLFIDKLNPNKSEGLDFIGPQVFKLCGDASQFFIYLQRKYGVFPDDLKKAFVTPIWRQK